MTSLQICRLASLVTSKNKSEVVFLILKKRGREKTKVTERGQHHEQLTGRGTYETVYVAQGCAALRRTDWNLCVCKLSVQNQAHVATGPERALRGHGQVDTAGRGPHLGLLTVGDGWEGDHVPLGVHQTRVVFLPIQQVKVSAWREQHLQ